MGAGLGEDAVDWETAEEESTLFRMSVSASAARLLEDGMDITTSGIDVVGSACPEELDLGVVTTFEDGSFEDGADRISSDSACATA